MFSFSTGNEVHLDGGSVPFLENTGQLSAVGDANL